MNKKTIIVGMSGGVDSSITAWILKEQGHEVIGATMSIWDGAFDFGSSQKSGCYGPGEKHDIEAAQKIATQLGIRRVVVDLKEEYKKNVIDYFCNEYVCGKTPNPCVVCNRKIKFEALLNGIKKQGISFDLFATGHYARIDFCKDRNRYILKRGLDPSKDQSYFLSFLSQEQLSRIMLPLGGMNKAEVKALASKIGMSNLSEKKESQDFIEADSYDVLFKDRKIESGDIVDATGKILGRHEGIINYTIGQRKGIGVSGSTEALYVLELDACKNRVIVGPKEGLFTKTLFASGANFISIPSINEEIRVSARIRSQHKPAEAILKPSNKPGNGNCFIVEFNEPQISITPGQTVTVYNNDEVVCAGVIESH